MNTKVRLVRCPGCQQVLPEFAELPVYKCGGCSIILKGKTQKNYRKAKEPYNNSSLNPTLPSTEESASASSEGAIEFTDHKRNQFVCGENSTSVELTCRENEYSLPNAHAYVEPDDNNNNVFRNSNHLDEAQSSSSTDELRLSKSPMVENNRIGQNVFGKHSDERLKEVCLSSSELTCNDIEELSQVTGSGTEMAEDSKSCFIFRSLNPDDKLVSRLMNSSHRHNELLEQRLWRPRVHHSQYKPEYHKSDKVELLRMVYELQNRLNKTKIHEHKWLSSNQHDRLGREREISDRHQVHCSEQLPSCGKYRYNQSGLLSSRAPQQLRDEKRKQHLCPIAGGCPIIACYRCFQVLKVPIDFLLFRRRHHRLRCGACSEVLKFSLQNRIHIVRYIPDDIAPPPSEVDDYTDASKKKKSVIEMCDNKDNNAPENFDCAGQSMELSRQEKSSQEIKEIRAGRSSALHRLMGYSSPSRILNG